MLCMIMQTENLLVHAKSGLIRGIIYMKKYLYMAWIMEAEESETDLALDRFYLNSRNKFVYVFRVHTLGCGLDVSPGINELLKKFPVEFNIHFLNES